MTAVDPPPGVHSWPLDVRIEGEGEGGQVMGQVGWGMNHSFVLPDWSVCLI